MELKTIQDQNKDCRTCAYHESGHILFAYLCGYHCREAQLIDEGDEGFSSYVMFDFGRDSEIASLLMNGETSLDFFRCLALGQRLEAIEVGRRLVRIFLGGSVATDIFRNHGNVHIPLPVQLDFTDLQRAEFIQGVIHAISSDKEENFIEHGLQEALYTLSNINIWNTVHDLAERLLEHKQLDRNDIEECLEEHGILFDEESPWNTEKSITDF